MTWLLAVGALFYFAPYLFGVMLNQVATGGFGQAFTSNSNPTVALVLMWISLAGVALVAAWPFVSALLSASRSMARHLSRGKSEALTGAAGGGE